MKKGMVLCLAGSLWLFTGVLGYAQTADKGNSGERKTIHKRSHSRFNAPHSRLEEPESRVAVKNCPLKLCACSRPV